MNKQLKQHAPDLINICAMPKNFGKAIGYAGPSKVLGVWWERAGDELAWSDGVSTFVGANYWPYLQLTEHKLAWALVEAKKSPLITEMINIGNSDQEATWWLILDIKNEDVYAAPRNQANALLRSTVGRVRIGHLNKPGLQPSIIAGKSLCDCGGGWVYDRAAYAFKRHALCSGTGLIYRHRLNMAG